MADTKDLAELMEPYLKEAEGYCGELLEGLATAKPEPLPTVKAMALLMGAYAQAAVIAEVTGAATAEETFQTFVRLITGLEGRRR